MLYGSKRNIIDLNAKNNFLAYDSFQQKVDMKIWFEVRSGESMENLNIRNDQEKEIEKNINSRYQITKILSVSAFDMFNYYTYYNLTLYSQYYNSIKTFSDSIILFFIRKPPSCKINPKYQILNPEQIVVLSSELSVLDFGTGDEVSYFWNCEECRPLLVNMNCTCNIFRHNQEYKLRELEIGQNMMSDLSKYIISLSITIKNKNYSRSCYSNIEVATISKAISVPSLAIYSSYGGNKLRDFYFGIDLASEPELSKAVKVYNWKLIEVVQRNNSKIIYSARDKYYANILKTYYNLSSDLRRLLPDSEGENITNFPPRVIASPMGLPPILGIARDDLMLGMIYTYALKIDYSDGKAPTYTSISFDTGLPLEPHTLLISPSMGVEYLTLFSFTFSSLIEPINSEISYEFYRKDCPMNPNSKSSSFTIRLKSTNSFSTILALGKSECDYQVQIILKVINGEDSFERTADVIVRPDETGSLKRKIDFLLEELQSSSSVYSLSQSLSMLNQISLIKNLEEKTIISILASITKYDSAQIETVLSSIDADVQLSFYRQALYILEAISKGNTKNILI